MGEWPPPIRGLRGPELQLIQYDEAAYWPRPADEAARIAQWTRRVSEGREVRVIEVAGRRSGKTIRAVERAAALAERGLTARVVVPHWFHIHVGADAIRDGYRKWWECVDCDRPIPIEPFVYDGEFPPIRSCGFRPELPARKLPDRRSVE